MTMKNISYDTIITELQEGKTYMSDDLRNGGIYDEHAVGAAGALEVILELASATVGEVFGQGYVTPDRAIEVAKLYVQMLALRR